MKCVLITVNAFMYIRNSLVRTQTEVTNTMSTVYTTLVCQYRHKNKGTGLVLVLRKCGVYKSDQESYKMCTVTINMKYTKCSSSHTHTEVTNTMSSVYTTLVYKYRHKNKDAGLVLVLGKCGVYKDMFLLH